VDEVKRFNTEGAEKMRRKIGECNGRTPEKQSAQRRAMRNRRCGRRRGKLGRCKQRPYQLFSAQTAELRGAGIEWAGGRW
jgi:hypothetical protein